MIRLRCAAAALALSWLPVASAAGQELSLPKPGPEHQILKKQEGVWNALIKSGGQESKGTMTIKVTCGGLWLTSEFVGALAGQGFEGRSIDGYDAQKKKYITMWVDSMSAFPTTMEGTYDESKKAIVYTGTGPGFDGKPAKYKSVVTDVQDDRFTFTIALVGADGAEMQVLEIEYSRKKKN